MTDSVIGGVDIASTKGGSVTRIDLLSDGRVRIARQLGDSPTEIEPGAVYVDAEHFTQAVSLWPQFIKIAAANRAA